MSNVRPPNPRLALTILHMNQISSTKHRRCRLVQLLLVGALVYGCAAPEYDLKSRDHEEQARSAGKAYSDCIVKSALGTPDPSVASAKIVGAAHDACGSAVGTLQKAYVGLAVFTAGSALGTDRAERLGLAKADEYMARARAELQELIERARQRK